jgi:hypothetical protein
MATKIPKWIVKELEGIKESCRCEGVSQLTFAPIAGMTTEEIYELQIFLASRMKIFTDTWVIGPCEKIIRGEK